ncbi:MAG: DUF5131 family protein, partial [Hyphomonas sp.]
MTETSIEWTDTTWNPVAGCSIMSAGCTNCYAMNMARRLELMGVDKYANLTRKSGKRTIWNNKIRMDEVALDAPRRWRKPRNVFVNSMSDLFHDGVTDQFILKVWAVMADTPRHNYQILTKRPDRMAQIMRDNIRTVLPNVWLGTSVENEVVCDRISELQQIPAAVRFISFEPLIGSIGTPSLENIHWAIVGGESGTRARPIQEAWVDEIYSLCQQYETAFFFKQWGTWGA